jgi:hypothetical protein
MITALQQRHESMVRYHAQAKRYLYEQGRLDDASQDELSRVADWLRYESFRRSIEPYERSRNMVMTRWLSLQVDPLAELPEEVRGWVAGWNELIASKAREFGYEVSP